MNDALGSFGDLPPRDTPALPPAAPAQPESNQCNALELQYAQPSTTSPDDRSPFLPLAPQSLNEAGLRNGEVESLILRFLRSSGSESGRGIADQLNLPSRLVRGVLDQMRAELLISYKSSAEMGDFIYQLTDTGVELAHRSSERCTYFGTAPVALDDYVRSVHRQSLAHTKLGIADLCNAFGDLLVAPEMISQLGQAVNAGRGLLLYGAPGNGKTSFAERITRAFGHHLWIPRTISISGDIIRLFDPSTHEELPLEDLGIPIDALKIDRRWALIRRPTIVVGSELTLDRLDIRFNPATGVNEAPIHLKSNGGVLVIDDFGRQRTSVAELLNRWIVPLEKRFDCLTLPSGRQIQFPIEQLLILLTNHRPAELVDEAFLRRIPYKIELADPTEDEFRKLFDQLAPEMGLDPRPEVIDHLIQKHYRAANRPFRFCHPRDLLKQVTNACEFLDLPLELTNENVDIAVKNYFARL